MLGNEGYRRDTRELTNQMPQGFHLFRCTPMNRYQHCIHRPLPHDAYGIRNGIPVHRRKTTAASGIDPGTFDR
jgi:hypothetical protein